MPDDFIILSIDGLKEIAAKLAKLPDAVADAGIESANKYLLDVLRTYPPYKYVSRKAAYGVSFFTAKQRRFFFAALADGRIKVPYQRTQGLSRAWKQVGSGRRSFLANEKPYADVVMGSGQSRHAARIGWSRIDKILKDRLPRIIEKFEAGVKKAIKILGL